MKQILVSALRRHRVALNVAEQMRYGFHRVLRLRSNRQFRRAYPSVSMPPAWIMYESSSSVDHWGCWRSGEARAAYLAQMADAHLPRPVRVCDWGCGPGRIVRHVAADESGVFSQVTATDYNARSIQWCRDHIPGVTFCVNDLAPPLPLPDASIDLLYGFSVLTHLSEEMCALWMEELMRVVRPGGCILVTVHGDRFRRILLDPEKELYDAGRFVGRGSVTEGSRMYVAFHSPAYFRSALPDGLDVLAHDDRSPLEVTSGQDAWLLRRR